MGSVQRMTHYGANCQPTLPSFLSFLGFYYALHLCISCSFNQWDSAELLIWKDRDGIKAAMH